MKTNRWAHEASHTASRIGVGAVALAALLAAASPAAAQFAGRPSLASVSGAGARANADSWAVSVSADGKIVAFASDAANLVALDNNGDTDVFVHDTVTGMTKRVSVTWQEEEAVGDSNCPSISADGRFVAFSSRAWNMWQGAEHINSAAAVWEVYVHDRQGPQTIRLTAPLGGGPGTKNSGCPMISADGNRVTFSSEADDLVPDDENGAEDVFVYDIPSGSLTRVSVADDESEADAASNSPVISADGTLVAFTSYATNLTPESAALPDFARMQVYARDLSAETTELVSRAVMAPLPLPNGQSCCPQISADGRSILFHSFAGNLLFDSGSPGPMRLFVRDRSDEVTEAIEPLSLGDGPCGSPSDPLCDGSHTKGAVISPDGRFVAFLSASFGLLPENPLVHRDQVFLQDRLTRRLRRVSVDPTGYPINAYPCGGSASTLGLSADGQVLAYVGGDTAGLGLPAGGAPRDVVRLEWPCDEGECRTLSLCPGTPATTCEPAQHSRLRIRRNPPLSARRDRFQWRWAGEGTNEGQPFINPSAGGKYQLCVYAGETMSAQIDAGIPAYDGWKRIGKGWQRRDDGGAVESVTLRSGAARGMIKVVTSSPSIDLPYLPLEAPQGVTVQLHESNTNRCWEAEFSPSAMSVNRRGSIAPGKVTPGAVHANF